MRAPAVRKLCTLSSFFRSGLANKPKNRVSSVNDDSSSEDSSDGYDDVARELSSLMHALSVKKLASREIDGEEKGNSILHIPMTADIPDGELSHNRQKEATRRRKQEWVFNYTSNVRFDRLLKMFARKLGTTATVDMFGQLGRETGLNEYNALIKLCINKARETSDKYLATEEMSKAFHLFKLMRECGFQLEEQTYRPVLQYIIDMGLVQEFQLFSDVIKADNPRSISRLGYYEMMLWKRVNNEEKLSGDMCEYTTVKDSKDPSALLQGPIVDSKCN